LRNSRVVVNKKSWEDGFSNDDINDKIKRFTTDVGTQIDSQDIQSKITRFNHDEEDELELTVNDITSKIKRFIVDFNADFSVQDFAAKINRFSHN